MNMHVLSVLVIGLALCGIGCRSSRLPRELTVPHGRTGNAGKYVRLCETDIKIYEETMRAHVIFIKLLHRELTEKFGHVQGMQEFADRVLSGERKLWEETNQMIEVLRRSAEDGAKVYEFEFADGTKREWGFLVMKRGTVVKRHVLFFEDQGK